MAEIRDVYVLSLTKHAQKLEGKKDIDLTTQDRILLEIVQQLAEANDNLENLIGRIIDVENMIERVKHVVS